MDKVMDIEPQIFVQNYSSLRNISRDYAKAPSDLANVTGVWYWGPTGSGKSFSARSDFPDAYMKLPNKWWDGYMRQDYVILDDFDKKHDMLGYHLKIWADKYAFPAEIKGSTIRIRPLKVVITSNYHPQDIWGSEQNTIDPILRRFKIVRFGNAPNAMSEGYRNDQVRPNFAGVRGFNLPHVNYNDAPYYGTPPPSPEYRPSSFTFLDA